MADVCRPMGVQTCAGGSETALASPQSASIRMHDANSVMPLARSGAGSERYCCGCRIVDSEFHVCAHTGLVLDAARAAQPGGCRRPRWVGFCVGSVIYHCARKRSRVVPLCNRTPADRVQCNNPYPWCVHVLGSNQTTIHTTWWGLLAADNRPPAGGDNRPSG